MAGGDTADDSFDTSGEFYDPSSNTWYQEGSLANSGLWWPGMAALHGKIYIVGGSPPPMWSGTYTASGEVYDVSSNGLISGPSIAAMSEARGLLGLAALNGKLYAVGGYGVAASNTGEVYTPNPS